jgi:hypothetical protein
MLHLKENIYNLYTYTLVFVSDTNVQWRKDFAVLYLKWDRRMEMIYPVE